MTVQECCVLVTGVFLRRVYIIVAGWWGHQPGRPPRAVSSPPTRTAMRQFEMHPPKERCNKGYSLIYTKKASKKYVV